MNEIEILKEILLNDDVVNSIKNNEKSIFKIIPLLKYEKGFEQNSEWHAYDVWNHTINAVSSSPLDFEIRLVLLLHDIGKPFSYQDDGEIRHFKGHALKSNEIASSVLKRLGYQGEKLKELLFLIGEHATTINIDDVNYGNVDLYEKLLIIQFCDASAYEPSHAKQIIERLIKIREKIQNKNLKKEVKNYAGER